MSQLTTHARRYGTPTVLCAAVATFVAFAAASSGFPVQHVSLNDGGIWVTDNAFGAVGRFNKPIAQLDGLISATSAVSDLDVVQNGALAAAWDKNAGRLYPIDVFKPAFGEEATVSAAQVALGGQTLAVLGTDHTLRTATLSATGGNIDTVDATTKALAAHLPANAAVAVAADNTVYVAGGGQLRSFRAGNAGQPVVSAIPLPAADPMQITIVGDSPVVADARTRTIYLPGNGRTVTLPGSATSAFMLQQPSAPSTVVVAATTRALYSVSLATGQPVTLSTGHSGDTAAPVQVAGCIHAAWNVGATGTYVRNCDGQSPTASSGQTFSLSSASPSLVFRVNRDEVVLNDTTDGGVFLADKTITSVRPNWQQPRQPSKNHKAHHKATARQPRAPLIARPDTQGARPGRTTVVHVLDNDSGPSGDVLAVTSVGPADERGVTVSIAPDAQAVLATVAGSLAREAHFSYTIDDGHGHTAQAQVTLVPRSPGQNSPPALRRGYHPPDLTVASGASLAIPVIGDWRDFDGDPLYIDNARLSATAGFASVSSSDGDIAYTAPQTASARSVTIHYAVSDGIVATPAAASLTVHVLAASSTDLVPPTAEPDVAQAVVGQPMTLHPLANDLPGADPTNPQAQLAIAGPVSAVPGAVVTTDAQAGTVTFTAQRPGSFFLGYDAAFGAARTSHATIRIQVSPATGHPEPPVTVPALAIIHGQQPAVVDVLASDYDPQGWILGIVGAASADPTIHVAIIAQHWLRVSSNNPQPGTTSTVTYTVSDGYSSAIGTVSVTAAPASADQITARDDSVVIRAGDSAAVPVLVNDSSSAGLPLSLDWTAPTASPAMAGLLASNQGDDVRVTAPASVAAERETTVSYVATDASGATATGYLHVTIVPPPSAAHPDQAPASHNVIARETAGDVLVIRIPTDGIDPDGDPTAVTAVTQPPRLGRIVAIGPATIAYQSYPTSGGTDNFTYQFTDPYGGTGTAQVSVGIMPPGPPQPPVAADDIIDAPPGARLHVDVLANDYVAPGDHATVIPLATANRQVPAGVTLKGAFMYLRVPASSADPPLEVTYGITDGSAAPSLAHVIVRAVDGVRLAPIANDDAAPAPARGARTVTVNVLRNDDDPVGSRADLRITAVAAGVRIHGASLVIPVAPEPREIPYQITAPDGRTASAVVDVPGSATSAITLKHGARIVLKPRGTLTVPLNSVIADADGRPLQITTVDRLLASPPGDISIDAHQPDAFVVHALGGYAGPGAVTVQVYDGTSLQDPRGHVATITIPVQVGSDVPLMRCPKITLPAIQGGSPQVYDIGLLCHVWVDTTITAPAPRYAVSWVSQARGVSATVVNGTGLRLAAASGARLGSAGRLRLTPAGAATGGDVRVIVTPAPLPVGRPATIPDVRAGHRVTVDLSQYVTSPLAQPHIQVVSVTHPADATVTSSGSVVAITPAGRAHGAISVVATVTDLPGKASRRISVAITAQVVGLPGAPGQPSATVSSHAVAVSFAPAAPNGAPVDHYTVYANHVPHACLASPCTITGLQNNVAYAIYVTAHNIVGDGPPSGHVTARPNQVPDQVLGLTTNPGDRQVGLSWQPAVVDGSPVTHYVVEISPAPAGSPLRTVGGSATSLTIAGLTNGDTYRFRVDAVNSQGNGPWSSTVSDIPYGKPATMPAPTATGANVPNPQATRAITVSWPAGNDNGRPITGYTVREYRSSSPGGPWAYDTSGPVRGATDQAFTVSSDGTYYEYTVSATNAAGSSAPSPQSAPVQGAAPPDAPATPSAADHDSGSAAGYNGAIHVSFTVPRPNSARLTMVQYGLNAQASGPGQFWSSPGLPGSTVNESITGLSNNTPYVVYVRGCNDAGLCGPWSGPSNQVVPYGPPGAPSVSAQANGTSITYTWNGGGNNGRPVGHYHVCFDGGSCTDTGAGSTTTSYGYSQTHTVTAYVIDSTGQQSAVATASATTVAAPAMSVSLSQGPGTTVSGCGSTPPCYSVDVTVTGATPGATLNYACFDNGTQFWPTSGTVDTTWSGAIVRADGSGSASWRSQCVWGFWGNGADHLQVAVNGTYSP